MPSRRRRVSKTRKTKKSRRKTGKTGRPVAMPVSVNGTPLRRCSEPGTPQTGYSRDGVCRAHRGDAGSHHVCLRDVDEGSFCAVTGQTDWCASKQDWCVCEWAFDTAVRKAGCDAFDVKCDATNRVALEHYAREGRTHAADCIRRQCPQASPSLSASASSLSPPPPPSERRASTTSYGA